MSELLIGDIIARLNKSCLDKIGLDIGANHGSYTPLIAKQCMKTYAFEPNLENFRTLMENVKDENVIFVNGAVGTENGLIKLWTCRSNPGGHTISPAIANATVYDHDPNRFKMVQSVSLDNYFGDTTNIGFIKIDVEGAEEFVLRGASKILDNNKIIIALETHQTINRDSIYNYMSDKGYVILDQDYKVVPKQSFTYDQHYLLHNHADLDEFLVSEG